MDMHPIVRFSNNRRSYDLGRQIKSLATYQLLPTSIEVNLASVTGMIMDVELEFLVRHISPNVEKLNLNTSNVGNKHIKILLKRQNILSGEQTNCSYSLKSVLN